MFITNFLSRKTDYYNQRLLFTNDYYNGILPLIDTDCGIAKNIFQIALLGNNLSVNDVMESLPPAFVDNINTLKKNNPEYEYHLYSDKEAEQFIKKYYGDGILEYYQRIDNTYLAAKADLLRYLLLYALGGVYLDFKSTIEKPLSENLREDDQFLVFYWDNFSNGNHNCLIPDYIVKGEMLQGFIISSKGHIFLREVILNVLKRIDRYNPYNSDTGVGWSGVITTVGPAVYTKSIYDIICRTGEGSNFVFRESKPFGIFGYKVYFAEEKYTPGGYLKSLSMKDFRKSSRPVVKCQKKWLQKANVLWLKLVLIYNRILIKFFGY